MAPNQYFGGGLNLPNRIIRESCRTSETLDFLSDGAERMFWRLTTVADDFGRFHAEPLILKASCFPRSVDRIKTAQIEKWRNEMIACNLIKTYIVGGQLYGFLITWEKYQNIRAKKSKHPEPTSANICEHLYTDANICLQLKTNVPEYPTENRVSNRESEPSIQPEPSGSEFEQFWRSYPRKIGKAEAQKSWNKKNPQLDKALAALQWQKQSIDWTKDGGQFIPYPATYLNQERWNDEVNNGSANGNSSGQRTATQSTGGGRAGPADWDAEQRRADERRSKLTADSGSGSDA